MPGEKLKLYNSLSRTLEEFVPNDVAGNHVKWYCCGPTVYDSAHMGHARSYISFDILRRVLSQYFGYNVQYVMNITDIDDKIIKRGRLQHLLEEYKKVVNPDQVPRDVAAARELYVQNTQNTQDPEVRGVRERVLAKMDVAIAENGSKTVPEEAKEGLVTGARDALYDWLDASFMKSGDASTLNNKIFADFAAGWERDFFEDMEALNILPPDTLTRVSEYVPEIVNYIEQIIKNGYAYASNGSVYFDVQAYKTSPNHRYAKLVPEAVGDAKALAEGEGELVSDKVGEKKSAADFALWKNSRLGEPSWESPWGTGRPGWHIECSAMACAILGSSLDIHTGGVDLKFPHHDNEIAQSEAYFDCDAWVKYFLHSGHLTISGCKMSKSLKNFITIKEALQQFSASQLRLLFLLHSWKDTLDYSLSGMDAVISFEKAIQEFFLTVKDIGRTANPFPKWNSDDIELQRALDESKANVHKALCDNVDSKEVMMTLKSLIGSCNVYIKDTRQKKAPLNYQVLKAVAVYITNILRIFGVVPSGEVVSFGLKPNQQGTGNAVNEEDVVLPFLNVISDFREKVRITSRTIENSSAKTTILKDCDLIRDEVLPELGVRLEDIEGSGTVIKYVGKEAMRVEMELKKKLEQQKEAEKLKKKQEQERMQQEKEAQRRIPPTEMFKSGPDADKYSLFDESGMPTHDKEGQPIPKSQLKKLQKLHAAQTKKYEEYLASVAKSS